VLAILRTPGVMSLFLASCVARLPMGALGLLLVLHTRDLTGSYARGGLVTGIYVLALCVSAPILARMVDRRGQTAVLQAGAVLEAAAVLALALLPREAPFGAIVVAAILAGLSQPPIGSCMRALWPSLFEGEAGRHAAYSLEGVALEVVYITGPVAIVAGIGSWSIRAALAFCAVVVVAGNLAFSLNRVSRAWQPDGDRGPGMAGALRGSGMRVLVAVFALAGLALGAVEVAVPAALDEIGQRNLTGLLFGFWGLGSMLAGLAVARAGPGGNAPRRLALLLVAWGAAHTAIGLAGSPAMFGVLLLAAGLAIAPTFVTANGMLDELAPRGTLTEAFTWLSTGMGGGIALGSAIAGAVSESASPGTAMVVLGTGAFVAAGIVALTARGPLRAARAIPATQA
jgi:MFS family permease